MQYSRNDHDNGSELIIRDKHPLYTFLDSTLGRRRPRSNEISWWFSMSALGHKRKLRQVRKMSDLLSVTDISVHDLVVLKVARAFPAPTFARNWTRSRATSPRSGDRTFLQKPSPGNGSFLEFGRRFSRILAPEFAYQRDRRPVQSLKARHWRAFQHQTGTISRSDTGWLGREGSNLRMGESKSPALPLGYAPIALTGLRHGRFKISAPKSFCLK